MVGKHQWWSWRRMKEGGTANRVLLKRYKRYFLNEKLAKAENDRTTDSTQDFYRTTRFLETGFSARSCGIENEKGNLKVDKESSIKILKDYFE